MTEEKKESPPPETPDSPMGSEQRTGAKEDILKIWNGMKSLVAKAALWATRNRWIVLGALMAIQTLFAILIFKTQRNGREENAFVCTLGLVFSHPLLFSFWAALAPQRFFVRFSWCLTLCALNFFFIALKCVIQKDILSCFYISIIDMAIFLLTLPILLFIRHAFGWRLENASLGKIESDYRSFQFGIKHLMLLTASTALVLALYKSLIALSSITFSEPVDRTIQTLIMIFFMVLPILFVCGFTLFKFHNRRSIVVSAISLACLECTIFYFIPKMREMSMETNIIVFFQIGAGLSALVSGLVIRLCGYRLVRAKK
jgi:hypothetical protein